MRLRLTLGLGIPAALLAAGATFIGPDRLQNLRCHATGCDLTTRLEQLCRAAEQSQTVPPLSRATARADALEQMWATAEMHALLREVEHAPPGGAYDVLLDALEAEGREDFSCPALSQAFAAPVAITRARIVVQGRTLLRLEHGQVPANRLGGAGLEIEGLEHALGYTQDHSEMKVSAPAEASFGVLTQVVYSLGRAGVPRVRVEVQDDVPRGFALDLPRYAACPACLADVPELVLTDAPPGSPQLLAAVGRHGATSPPFDAEDLHVLVLPSSGEHLFLSESMTTTGPSLFVISAPQRSLRDLSRALRTVRGPEAAPRFSSVSLALLEGRLGQDPRVLIADEPPRVGLATQAALQDRRVGSPSRTSPRARLLRRPAPRPPAAPSPRAAARPRSVVAARALRAAPPPRPATARRARAVTPGRESRPMRAAEPAPRRVESSRPPPRRSEPRDRKEGPVLTQITESLRPKMRALRDCYERALKTDTSLSGKVTLLFDVDVDGRASGVRLVDHSLDSPGVTACIRRRARQWRLPTPGNEPIAVAYPLVFTPTGI